MCTQRRKYPWPPANNCEETREKVRENEIQMNFQVRKEKNVGLPS